MSGGEAAGVVGGWSGASGLEAVEELGIEVDAVAAADGEATGVGIPSEAEAGSGEVVAAFDDGLFVAEAAEHSGAGLADGGSEAGIEDRLELVDFGEAALELPAETEVEGEGPGDLKIVLEEEAVVVHAETAIGVAEDLGEGGGGAGEEGIERGEVVDAAAGGVVDGVVLNAAEVDASFEDVAATDMRDDVGDLIDVEDSALGPELDGAEAGESGDDEAGGDGFVGGIKEGAGSAVREAEFARGGGVDDPGIGEHSVFALRMEGSIELGKRAGGAIEAGSGVLEVAGGEVVGSEILVAAEEELIAIGRRRKRGGDGADAGVGGGGGGKGQEGKEGANAGVGGARAGGFSGDGEEGDGAGTTGAAGFPAAEEEGFVLANGATGGKAEEVLA